LSWSALPTPMLTTIFCSRGRLSTFCRPNFFCRSGMISFWYLSSKRAMARLAMSGVFEGMGGARLGQHAQAVAALLAEALLGAVGRVAPADPHAAAAVGAVEQDVGGADGQLHGQLPALGVAAAGLDVLLGAVDALDHDLAFPGQDAQ